MLDLWTEKFLLLSTRSDASAGAPLLSAAPWPSQTGASQELLPGCCLNRHHAPALHGTQRAMLSACQMMHLYRQINGQPLPGEQNDST